jgi:hypothetical protein
VHGKLKNSKSVLVCIFVFVVLGLEPRASNMWGELFTTDKDPLPVASHFRSIKGLRLQGKPLSPKAGEIAECRVSQFTKRRS